MIDIIRLQATFPFKANRFVVKLAILIALLVSGIAAAYADVDPSSAQSGRLIFFKGEKSSGESLTANVGGASIPVPATALPCLGCHGRDGQGRPEGGVRPSNITWFNLTKEYGGNTIMGRRYDAYDETSFLTAVTEGTDSAGNKLDSSMPRYNVSRQDARDLIAYLKVIQDDFDPGVSADEIIFGTLQPSSQVQARMSDAMIEVMRVRLDEVNAQGGVFGKQLRLKVTPYHDRQSFLAESNKMVGDERVFALVNVFSSTADQSLIDMVEQAEIPSIAPYTQLPAAADGRHLYTFYLHGGLDAQIEVLARRVGKEAPNSSSAYVFYRQGGGFEEHAKKALALLEANNIADTRLVAYTAGDGKWLSDLIDLQAYENPVILFLGPSGDLVELLGPQAPTQTPPYLLMPGFFVNSHILKLKDDYAEGLEMAYITVPGGNDSGALTKFRQFMQRNRLQYDHVNARLFAYSATEILVEGVKRAGKRITRKKLVDSVEELYAFDAGLNRPISFGSQRRVGLKGAYVVQFDADKKRLTPTGIWVGLD